jgi:hypothetical protein
MLSRFHAIPQRADDKMKPVIANSNSLRRPSRLER